MKCKTYEEFLQSISAEDRHYYTNMSRGYYDKEKYKRTAAADIKHAAQKEDKDRRSIEKKENLMALYYCKDGFPFLAPPYSEEENWEFEQRLRRGGDITIIRQRQPDRPEPLPDDPEQ
jgi:hypothetical protein